MWTKQGNIFNEHHAQVPVADTYSDTYKIYYSARGENGKSIPMTVNFFKSDLSKGVSRYLITSKSTFASSKAAIPCLLLVHLGLWYIFIMVHY